MELWLAQRSPALERRAYLDISSRASMNILESHKESVAVFSQSPVSEAPLGQEEDEGPRDVYQNNSSMYRFKTVEGTHPTLRIALRNTNSVWSRYRPRSVRTTPSRPECMSTRKRAQDCGRLGEWSRSRKSIKVPLPQAQGILLISFGRVPGTGSSI